MPTNRHHGNWLRPRNKNGGWLRLHPELCAPNTKGLIMPTQTGEFLPLVVWGEVTEVVNLNPVTTLHAAKKLVRARMETLKFHANTP